MRRTVPGASFRFVTSLSRVSDRMAIHGLFDDTRRLRYIADLLTGPNAPTGRWLPTLTVRRLSDRCALGERAVSGRGPRRLWTPRSESAHLVVPGVVSDLGEPERLQQRRQVDAEPAAQSLL